MKNKKGKLNEEVLRKNILNGCEVSKEILIKENYDLVHKIANSYRNSGLPYEDIVQEGLLGLLIAMKKWTNKDECSFSSYAYYWIKFKIADAVLRNRGVKIFEGRRGKRKVTISYEENNDLEQKIMPTFNEEELMMYRRLKSQSLLDRLEELTDLEKLVIYSRYGLEGEKRNLSDLSFELNLSMGGICKIEKRALKKMKDNFHREGIYVMSQL